jgi:hypothetical protein
VRLLPNLDRFRAGSTSTLDQWDSLVSVSPNRVSADEDLAQSLGWTRGELFTSLETILFVEGVADQRILEAFFSVQLRAAGILVSPIHGITKAPAIAAAELIRMMPGVRRALLVDGLAADSIDELKAMNNDQLEAHSKDRKASTEGQAIAALLRELPQPARDALEIYPHEAPDVIALLDETALAAELPAYPGHAAMRRQLAEQPADNPRSWKSLMAEFGFRKNDPGWQIDLVERLIARMQNDGSRPRELQDVIERVAAVGPRP